MLPRMADEPEPTPRTFTFKPKEFERVNAPRPEVGDDTPAAAPLAKDVFAMQRDLRAREIAAGMDQLKPVDRPESKRRRRDYWLLLLTGYAILASAALIFPGNPVVLLYVFAGIVLFSIGLTWVMWFVMGRY
ncbi:MAG: hypothetical protein C0518_09745 [Opitutus sp.]|nr:hypothetical protein [Opitutus sp.]